MTNKIHARFGFFWDYPVHECIVVDVRTKRKTATSNITLVTHDPHVEAKLDKQYELKVVLYETERNYVEYPA